MSKIYLQPLTLVPDEIVLVVDNNPEPQVVYCVRVRSGQHIWDDVARYVVVLIE